MEESVPSPWPSALPQADEYSGQMTPVGGLIFYLSPPGSLSEAAANPVRPGGWTKARERRLPAQLWHWTHFEAACMLAWHACLCMQSSKQPCSWSPSHRPVFLPPAPPTT